jgi:hypothetical protein
MRLRAEVDCVWNVMAHAQKPDFVFRRNGRVHLNRRGNQFSRLLRALHTILQGLHCSHSPVFCSHVTLTGYPLHSPVSPSLLLPCVTVCHHISDAVYSPTAMWKRASFRGLCIDTVELALETWGAWSPRASVVTVLWFLWIPGTTICHQPRVMWPWN